MIGSEPTIQPTTQISPPVEVFTEIRCPACVPLGWDSSRLLFKVHGVVAVCDARLQLVCHRCKSLVEWRIGLPILTVIEKGQRRRSARVAFE